MEKFYIVPVGTKLHSEYMTYKQNTATAKSSAIRLLDKYGVEAEQFCALNTEFGIVATDNDLEKFSKDLRKPRDGVHWFKARSAFLKEWRECAKDISPLHKPFVGLHFKTGIGKCRSRLFDINGVVYCSFETDGLVEPLESYTELKQSEFWRIVESAEED